MAACSKNMVGDGCPQVQSVGVGGLCHAQLCPQTGDGPAEARRLYIFHDRDLLLKTQLPQDPDKREAQPGSTQHQIALVGMWGGAHGGGGDSNGTTVDGSHFGCRVQRAQ